MNSVVGRLVRSETIEELADSIPGSFGIFRHLLRVGLSNFMLTHKAPLFFPIIALLILVLERGLYVSLIVQFLFIFTLFMSDLLERKEKLKRYSPILRELFHYLNCDLKCKMATLHVGLSVLLYSFNWLAMAYYAFVEVLV